MINEFMVIFWFEKTKIFNFFLDKSKISANIIMERGAMLPIDNKGRFLCEKCADSIENQAINTGFLIRNGVLFCENCINCLKSEVYGSNRGNWDILFEIISKWDNDENSI